MKILLHFYVYLYNKIQNFLKHHVHFTPFMCGKGLSKIQFVEIHVVHLMKNLTKG